MHWTGARISEAYVRSAPLEGWELALGNFLPDDPDGTGESIVKMRVSRYDRACVRATRLWRSRDSSRSLVTADV